MNRIAIFAAATASILLLPSTHASAQIGITLTGGVNYASMSITGADDPVVSAVTRYTIGMSTTIPLSRNFGIQLGGALSQKGGQVGGEEEVIVHFNHFEGTLLARASLPLAGERIRPYLAAGPAVAWESSCTVKIALATGGPYQVIPCGADEFHDRDFGLAAAVGIELALSTGLGVTLGAAYAHGLRDMESGGANVKLRTATLRGGFVYWIR